MRVVRAAGARRRVTLYRVVDARELAHLVATGDYGSNASRSGKYFALTLAGARAFAAHPANAGCTITRVTILRTVLSQGWEFIDPGPFGAGPSVFFAQAQLALVYGDMTVPGVV